MALIQDAQQRTPQASTQPQAGGQMQLDPEKQKLIKEGYRVGRNLIYNQQVFDTLMKDMESGKKAPPAILAESIVFVLEKIQESMSPPFDVLLGIGLALISDLASTIEETGRMQFSEEDIGAAVQQGIQMYLMMHGKEIDQGELQMAMQDMQGAAGPPSESPQPGGMPQ